MFLSELPNGTPAVVEGVAVSSQDVDGASLRRLEELGFIAGEPLEVLRRGPGGRQPLAVMIGDTLLALRQLEAQCISVRPL